MISLTKLTQIGSPTIRWSLSLVRHSRIVRAFSNASYLGAHLPRPRRHLQSHVASSLARTPVGVGTTPQVNLPDRVGGFLEPFVALPSSQLHPSPAPRPTPSQGRGTRIPACFLAGCRAPIFDRFNFRKYQFHGRVLPGFVTLMQDRGYIVLGLD